MPDAGCLTLNSEDRGREGGKQLSPVKICLVDHFELRNCTVSSCICKV